MTRHVWLLGMILIGQMGCLDPSLASLSSFRFSDSAEKAQVARSERRTSSTIHKGTFGPSPSKVFRSAYKDYLKGRYELAIASFRQFIKDYPSSSLAPQAYFYLGEAYYNSHDVASAEKIFGKLASEFSSSRFVPPALFKLGNMKVQRDDPQSALNYWTRVIEEFPGSPEAKLAQQGIAKLQ